MKHSFSICTLSFLIVILAGCSKNNSTTTTTTKVATVTTIAGSGTSGSTDGLGKAAQFNHPFGIAIDGSGNLYIGEEGNSRIRKISTAATVTTFAGSSVGYLDASGTSAKFFNPDGVAIDGAGNIYVADNTNNRIRKITSAGVVSTLAGGTEGYVDGTGTAAQFFNPTAVAVDGSGNVYVTDTYNQRIRKITAAGVVTTIAGSGKTGPGNGGYADGAANASMFSSPSGIALDGSGNLYVADYNNFRIRKINTSGTVSTLAGSIDGEADGTGSSAQFGGPTGIVVAPSGNIFVADALNTIRQITPSGVTTTIAGVSGSGYVDGTGPSSRFSTPAGITIDGAGNLYVADYGNNVIRKISFQ